MKHFVAWAVLVISFLAVVPLFCNAVFYGWLAGGPPSTPERRQWLLFYCYTNLVLTLGAPIVGMLMFRSLRRRRPHDNTHEAASRDETNRES